MGTRGLLRRARPLLVSAIREMDTCSPRINSKLSLLLARLCQSKGNTMTKPLSPAAEAIFFAADGMQPRQYRGRALAAAIRELADQVVPDEGHTLPIHVSSAEWLRFDERKKIRADILAIATELEGQ